MYTGILWHSSFWETQLLLQSWNDHNNAEKAVFVFVICFSTVNMKQHLQAKDNVPRFLSYTVSREHTAVICSLRRLDGILEIRENLNYNIKSIAIS